MRRTAHASCKSASIEISRARPRADASGPPRAHPRPRAPPRLESRACRKALMFRRAEAAPTSAANQMPVLTGPPKKRITAPPHIAFTDATEPAVRDTFYAGFYPSKFRLRADRCVSLTGNLRKCLIFMALTDVPVFHSRSTQHLGLKLPSQTTP